MRQSGRWFAQRGRGENRNKMKKKLRRKHSKCSHCLEPGSVQSTQWARFNASLKVTTEVAELKLDALLDKSNQRPPQNCRVPSPVN